MASVQIGATGTLAQQPVAIAVAHPVQEDPSPVRPSAPLFAPGSVSEGSGPTTGQISPRF